LSKGNAMSDNNKLPPMQPVAMRKLLGLIAVYFLVESLCDPEGLIYQSVILFFDLSHWSESEVNSIFTMMSIPLLVRPLYGILCDSVPLFGYKRKTYLAGYMLLNMVGFAAIALFQTPLLVAGGLFVVAIGISGGATVASGVIAETGQKHGNATSLLNAQWFWINLGVLAFALAGGWLARSMSATSAYRIAALIAAVGPMFVIFAVWWLLDEPRTARIDLNGLKQSLKQLLEVLKSGAIWGTIGFIVLYNISPLMKLPLIYHVTGRFGFSQEFVGILLAVGGLGAMAGSFVLRHLATRLSLKQLLYLGVVLTVLGRLSYLLLGGSDSALVLWFINGLLSFLVMIPCLTLATMRCPKGLEAFAYGTMTCFFTLSRNVGSWFGGWLYGGGLYEPVFAGNLTALILVSAALGLLALPFISGLKLGDTPTQE
jgi:predicted MFS family arabinose efflux permease